jgi:hypothetical protein
MSRWLPNSWRGRLLLFGLVLVAIAIVGGTVLDEALAAKSQLETVREQVHQLRAEISAGDFSSARETSADIGKHTKQAHNDTSGTLFGIASAVPFLGRPLGDERTIAQASQEISDRVVPALIDASRILDSGTLRRADGSVNLAPIIDVAPSLRLANTQMQDALAKIEHLPSSSWLPAADKARSAAVSGLTPLANTIDSVSVVADTVPSLFGAYGTQSYIVTFENEAELRGTGGLPGAFAIMTAKHGKLSFTRFEPDSTLVGVKSGLNLGTDFNETYDAADVTGDYRDANVSPNFPYAARIWIAEWKAKTGQSLTGAVTIDPTALSYLLGVTGPAQLADGTEVTSSNVEQLTQQTVYAKFGNSQNLQRKLYLLDIARAVSTKLLATSGSMTSLGRAAGQAASESRILVWSSDATIESELAATPISGVLPVTTKTFGAVALNNGGANKLDYYLHSSINWVGTGCGSTRKVTVTIKLTNDAPQHLPAYVLGFTGQPGFPQHPGDNVELVAFYGTAGGSLSSIFVNGTQTGVSSGIDAGHPVYTVSVPIARGTTSTVIMHLVEPGRGAPQLRLQPMVNPMSGHASAKHC